MRPDTPFPRPFAGPHYIFRLVKREERATYVRIMRRTYAVAFRDLNRAADRLARQLGKRLLSVMERLNKILGGDQ
jgi:uncharacterized protein YfbU (UPF0304 family)